MHGINDSVYTEIQMQFKNPQYLEIQLEIQSSINFQTLTSDSSTSGNFNTEILSLSSENRIPSY